MLSTESGAVGLPGLGLARRAHQHKGSAEAFLSSCPEQAQARASAGETRPHQQSTPVRATSSRHTSKCPGNEQAQRNKSERQEAKKHTQTHANTRQHTQTHMLERPAELTVGVRSVLVQQGDATHTKAPQSRHRAGSFIGRPVSLHLRLQPRITSSLNESGSGISFECTRLLASTAGSAPATAQQIAKKKKKKKSSKGSRKSHQTVRRGKAKEKAKQLATRKSNGTPPPPHAC